MENDIILTTEEIFLRNIKSCLCFEPEWIKLLSLTDLADWADNFKKLLNLRGKIIDKEKYILKIGFHFLRNVLSMLKSNTKNGFPFIYWWRSYFI